MYKFLRFKKNIVLGLLGAFLIVMVSAAICFAHKVNIFAYVEGDLVYTESYFPDGHKVEKGKIEIYDSRNNKLLTGITDKKGIFNFRPPKKDDLKISIESDGKVVAEDGVELSFSVSGNNLEIKEMFVKEGDKIKRGDKIATVKTETLELNVRNAYSGYLSSLASYNLVMDGATDGQVADAKDDITSAEISLNQTEISLENTKQTSAESIRDAEDAVYDDNQAGFGSGPADGADKPRRDKFSDRGLLLYCNLYAV